MKNKLCIFIALCTTVGIIPAGHAASKLTVASFPNTTADLAFQERVENKTIGYEPYKDLKAYHEIKIEPWEEAIAHELERLESQHNIDKITLSQKEYCDKYFDEEKCPQDRGREQYYIDIANNPNIHQNSQNSTSGNTTNNNTTQTPDNSAVQNIVPPQQTTPPPNSNPVTNHTPPVYTNNTVVANNRVHDGPCTQSARSNHFKNAILTTGKYEKVDPAFEKMMIQIFRVEGDCGSHPNDPGGYTCYGYAQKYNPDIDVRKLTRGGAEDRTYQRFYKAKNIDRLPDAVRGDVLRGDFGSGPGMGVKKLQQTLGLAQTGRVDDQLIRTAENFNGDLHQAYWDTMQEFYVDITRRKPDRKVFLKGWMNGVKLFRENGCHVVPAQPLTR